MQRINHYISTALVTACLFTVATVSMAGEYCEHRGGMGQGRHGMMDRQAHHQQLHDLLKLTPDQESAWVSFTSTEMPGKPMAESKADDMDKLTMPERADKMLALAKAHQQQMETHVAALKTFYAKLSAEQQKTFDQFHADHQPKRGPRDMEKQGMPAPK